MAKVLNPLNSAEARGKIGGHCYNTCRGVRYVKAATSPAQPRTARQLFIRNLVANLTRGWAAVTLVSRTAWGQYADNHPELDWTGSPLRLTALNWYVRCNTRLLDMAEAAITDPPAVPAPNAPTGLNISDATGDLKATWTAPATGNLHIDFWYIGPVSAGVAGRIERAKHLTYQLPAATKPITLIATAAPGSYVVWARTIDDDTGLASPFQKDQVTIAP